MPKARPDNVVIHRIELQEKEREMLQAYVGGTVVKNALVPAAIAAGVGSASYIGYKAAKGLVGWTEDALFDGALYNDLMEAITGIDPSENPKAAKPDDSHVKNALKGLGGFIGYGWLWG